MRRLPSLLELRFPRSIRHQASGNFLLVVSSQWSVVRNGEFEMGELVI
jgi:hypothetical protein